MDGCGALYLRISKDKNHGESTEDQEHWGREHADQHWPADLPIRVYCDDDLTAADENVHRPDYERLREDIRNGEVVHLWTVEQTRIERTDRWFQLAAELLAAGIGVLETRRDGFVTLDEVADIKAVFAKSEVRKLKKRVNDRLDRLAARGRPSGGTSFGYRTVVVGVDEADGKPVKTLVIIEEQAAAARWAAQAVLDGWSLAAIARKLEADGVPTRRGGRWSTQTVRSMLTNPTITGLRVHRGEVFGEGKWPAIIDRTTWNAVRQRLTEPAHVTDPRGNDIEVSRSRRPARKYLLTGGLARCGKPRDDGSAVIEVPGLGEVRVCGAPLVAQSRQGRTPGSRAGYFCVARSTRRGEPVGCGGLGIIADDLESYVIDRALLWATSPEMIQARDGARLQADTEVREIEHELGQIDAAERRADDMAVDGQLTLERHRRQVARLARRREPLQARLQELEAALAKRPFRTHMEEVAARWDDITLDERRRVLRDLLVVVYVLPAKPGTRKFDPLRVLIQPNLTDSRLWQIPPEPGVEFVDAVPVEERLLEPAD